MKIITKHLIFVLCLLFHCSSFAKTDENLMKEAEQLYINQNYEQALAIYRTLETEFSADWQLHYNIGNTFFKLSDIPSAILYFERALKINPCDENLKKNLKIANARLKGEAFPLPDFFVWRWIQTIAGQFFPKAWAALTLSLLILSCGGFCLYHFAQNTKVLTFYLFIFLSLLTLFSFSMGLTRSFLINRENYAIVFDANGLIEEENTEQLYGKQIKIKLFNGEKVEILERHDEFLIIETPEGNKVKINPNSLQVI